MENYLAVIVRMNISFHMIEDGYFGNDCYLIWLRGNYSKVPHKCNTLPPGTNPPWRANQAVFYSPRMRISSAKRALRFIT